MKIILRLLLTMLLVSFLTFAAFEAVSGDPVQTMLGTEATEEQAQALRSELGLDRPFIQRYFHWVSGIFTGDLGTSYSYRQSVSVLLGSKALVSFALCMLSFAMIVFVSIPLGLASYKYSGRILDVVRSIVNQICMAVPPFFTGILFSWIFGIGLRLFVPGSSPGFVHLFFAALCIAIPRIAMTVRLLRSTVVSEMNKAYVRTAISRGNDRSAVLRKHVLKNSLVSVISFLGQTLAELVGATIVVEQVMGIPGLGRFLVSSILHRDYPVIQAIVLILSFWVVLSGVIADLVNSAIDPRIKLSGEGRQL